MGAILIGGRNKVVLLIDNIVWARDNDGGFSLPEGKVFDTVACVSRYRNIATLAVNI